MLKDIVKKCLNYALRGVTNQNNMILAQTRLNTLGLNYIAHSNSSINVDAIEIILNDIIVNNRQNIVEFGSGVSTIYIAKVISNSPQKKFVSFEHDEGWIEVILDVLKKEKLESNVKLIHARLNKEHRFCDKSSTNFYDEKTVEKGLSEYITVDNEKKKREKKGVDCVVIDGPPAHMGGKELLSRLPALLSLRDFLSDEFSCFLDDINREGEIQILKHYRSIYKFDLEYHKSNMAYLRKGRGFTVTEN